MPRIGELNRRIAIYKPVTTRDAYGGRSKTWQSVVTTFAKWEPLRATEALTAAQLGQDITGKFIVRYRPKIETTYRVTWIDPSSGERRFDVESARDLDGRRRWTVINVKEHRP